VNVYVALSYIRVSGTSDPQKDLIMHVFSEILRMNP
jgi:hypothetical protein